eukprot:3829333-Prymnesium_polylepis.1
MWLRTRHHGSCQEAAAEGLPVRGRRHDGCDGSRTLICEDRERNYRSRSLYELLYHNESVYALSYPLSLAPRRGGVGGVVPRPSPGGVAPRAPRRAVSETGRWAVQHKSKLSSVYAPLCGASLCAGVLGGRAAGRAANVSARAPGSAR